MVATGSTYQLDDGLESSRVKATTVLGEVFSSRVRATLLSWIVPRLDSRFSLTELSRAVGTPISSLQHECYKLERLGVLEGRREGSSRRYRMRLDHHLSRALIDLVIATLSLEIVLQDAIGETGDVDIAAIVGPDPASGAGQLMLVLIGDIDLEGLDQAQQRVASLLGIEPDGIELAYFRRDEWTGHGSSGHPLLHRIARRPIQLITGAWPNNTDAIL